MIFPLFLFEDLGLEDVFLLNFILVGFRFSSFHQRKRSDFVCCFLSLAHPEGELFCVFVFHLFLLGFFFFSFLLGQTLCSKERAFLLNPEGDLIICATLLDPRQGYNT